MTGVSSTAGPLVLKNVLLAAPRGFCAGVVRAVEIVDLALDCFDPPIYVRREIVHNLHVVKSFEKRGVRFVQELSEVPDRATVVFSAHGVSPAVRAAGLARGLNIIDATCPLVTKVHLEAIRFAKLGYQILLIGHAGHEEVEGTTGEAPGRITLVASVAEAEAVHVEDPEKVAFLTQTTLSVEDTRPIVEALKRRFPRIQSPARDDICYATQNRQLAVRALARQAPVILVVGSRNSSNSNRLVEEAELAGARAYLVDDVGGVDPAWLDRCRDRGPDIRRFGAGVPGRRDPALAARPRSLRRAGRFHGQGGRSVPAPAGAPTGQARGLGGAPRPVVTRMREDGRLAGRVAFVTGASRGIGEAIGRRFAREGARVALAARDELACQRIAQDANRSGADAIGLSCDVTLPVSVSSAIAAVAAKWGHIDILVNNAGLGGQTRLDEPDDTRWNAILATNLTAVWRVTREAAPFLPQGARVINLSSVLGRFGAPGYSAYCASKHGVIGLTRALALELAPRQITVNAICPGWVETEMARNGFRSLGERRHGGVEEGREAAAKMAPLGRVLDPEEVAGIAVYIASAEAKSLTGQAIVLDGGQVMP